MLLQCFCSLTLFIPSTVVFYNHRTFFLREMLTLAWLNSITLPTMKFEPCKLLILFAHLWNPIAIANFMAVSQLRQKVPHKYAMDLQYTLLTGIETKPVSH